MKKILLLFFSFSLTSVFAQSMNCGIADESFETEIQRRQILAQLKSQPGFEQRNMNSVTYIAIKMHLFAQTGGNDYAPNDRVNNMIAKLNAIFQPIKVEFYFLGTDFNRYQNTHFNQGSQSDAQNAEFHGENGVTNAVNIYVASKVYANGQVAGGWTYYTPGQQWQNMMYLMTDGVDGDKLPAHEFGHYFSLRHTFDGSASSYIPARELVTRNFNEIPPRLSANCDMYGDYICDTPAEVLGLPGYVLDDCHYVGSEVDANGDAFAPDLSNIMQVEWCLPQHFTPGQYDRMEDGVLLVTAPGNGFTLDGPETLQPMVTNFTATNAGGDYYGQTMLNWTDTSSVETGFIIDRSTSPNGPFTSIIGVGANVTSVEDTTAEPGNTYYYRIKPSNTKTNYSAITPGLTIPTLCGNLYGQSCQFPDVNPSGMDHRIEGFKLKRDNTVLIDHQNSGCSQYGIGNYYEMIVADVNSPDALNFEVRSKADASSGNGFNVIAAIYADWNNDNDFDDPGESPSSFGPNPVQVSGYFNIPAGLPNGEYRMRVVLAAFDLISACGSNYGEIEDYKLIVNNLGTDDFSSQTVSIWPNPANDFLNIETSNPVGKLVITDMTGKTVHQQITDTKKANIAMLASGMYIVQVFSGDKKMQAKFVKM